MITVNVGAGSFAGFGMKPCVGGGKLWFNGAGAGSTSITGGPADFVYNIGECISAYVATHIDWWIGNLTVDGSALPSFAAPINLIAYNQLFRGDPTSATAPTIEHIANPATYHVTIFDFSGFGDNPLQNPSVTLSGDCSGYISAQSFSGASLNAAHTILGNPTWSDKFLKLDEIALVSTGNSTFTGSATGNQGSVTLNSVLNTAGAGTSYLPGTANTVTTATGGQYL